MKLSRMVHLLRLHLNDTQKIGWPDDDELIEYLDRASSFLTDRLITMRFNSLLRWIELDGPTTLPDDFVTFVGKVPVQIVGKVAESYARQDLNPSAERWRDPNIPDDDKRLTWGGKNEDIKPWAELTTKPVSKFLYWSRLPYPSSFKPATPEEPEQELSYTQDQNTLILDIARLFALNKNEYDCTQDLSIMSQIQQAMAQARGVADATDGDQ